MDDISDAERGPGFGLVRTVYTTLGATGSVVTGVTADVLGWTASFGLLAVIMAVGVGNYRGQLRARGRLLTGPVRPRWSPGLSTFLTSSTVARPCS
ncbi:hypothetical protein SAMN05192561_12211 [Halopenitus malekzadehii]|uniref:Major facilitator superfamily (MFS) profile domain-containing protein n=1 Tax=Halopenitus malekzadehii TaxID=1267564 RepID=A0A1H6JTE4_9EURY|nr:hypothetical protein [Halopenitus malekzadehii]SEH65565.1 hypothetical protein SAMN05192561_12211 [Halopenitus malekzadehii]